MKLRIDMEQVKDMAMEALRVGKLFVFIEGIMLPIRFIHNNGYAQYGLMTAFGEIVRLVMYSVDHIEAYLV